MTDTHNLEFLFLFRRPSAEWTEAGGIWCRL